MMLSGDDDADNVVRNCYSNVGGKVATKVCCNLCNKNGSPAKSTGSAVNYGQAAERAARIAKILLPGHTLSAHIGRLSRSRAYYS